MLLCQWHQKSTCMIWVPFLKLVKDLITSWLISSIAFFQSLLKPRTSWVTFPAQQQLYSCITCIIVILPAHPSHCHCSCCWHKFYKERERREEEGAGTYSHGSWAGLCCHAHWPLQGVGGERGGYLLSWVLSWSVLPRSMHTSQSLTNAIMPPKCGCSSSSMYSCVRADNSSFRHSDSLQSSVVLSYHQHTPSACSLAAHLSDVACKLYCFIAAHFAEPSGATSVHVHCPASRGSQPCNYQGNWSSWQGGVCSTAQ